MIESVKKYNEGKATGATSLQVTEDQKYVFTKQEYLLDESVFPPVVVEGDLTVYFTATRQEIEDKIAELNKDIKLLTELLK